MMTIKDNKLFVLILLLVATTTTTTQAAETPRNVKYFIDYQLIVIKQNINAHNAQYVNLHRNYGVARQHMVEEKKRYVYNSMMNLDVVQRGVEATCLNQGNSADECERVQEYYNSKVDKEIRFMAKSLSKSTQQLAAQFIPQIQIAKAYFESDMMGLQQMSDRIDKAVRDGIASESYFASCRKSIKIERSRCDELTQEIHGFVGELQTVVYGNMCFELQGASGKITTPAEIQEFHNLTESAMEIACTQEGIDADIVFLKIVKQELVSSRRQRQLRRELALLPKLAERTKLRVGTVIGIICNCVDDEPLSDVWSKRRLQEEEATTITTTTTTTMPNVHCVLHIL